MRTFALVLAALALAAPAAAQVGSAAVDELRSEGVYLAPDAEMRLTAAEERDLEDRIALADGRIFIAVLPASAGSPTSVLRELPEAVDRRGTYAVVVGKSFRAGSQVLPGGVVPGIATRAFERRADEGLAAVLREFVSLVLREEEKGATPAPAQPARVEDDAGPPWGTYALLGLGAGGIGFFILRRRRSRAAGLASARELAEDDLVALAEDVQALETEVAGNDAAESRYRRALDRYGEASARFDRVRSTEELAEVTSLVDEGRYEMACARAILTGRELPERSLPCFFDPRHGPSARDVVWSPPYGGERPVPACEACALLVDEGGEPDAREIRVGGGRRVPYWDSPAAGPWAAGYFGFGLLPALLLGSALGSGIGLGFPGDAGAGPASGDEGFGGGDFGDGGDFGGGDVGGGDFGGGDF